MQPNMDSSASASASASAARASKTLFFAEMLLSPVAAAIAYLVPAAANWGAFKYAPAIVAFLMAAPAVPKRAPQSAADDPSPPQSAVPDGASSNPAGKPMITQNPDGTFTVRKEPPSKQSKDAKVEQGLVIPAQVVVPMLPPPQKKVHTTTAAASRNQAVVQRTDIGGCACKSRRLQRTRGAEGETNSDGGADELSKEDKWSDLALVSKLFRLAVARVAVA